MTIAGAERLRLFRLDRPATALGLSVSYPMPEPAFAELRFGEPSEILVGLALGTRDKAAAWGERHPLLNTDKPQAECLPFTARPTNSTWVCRFTVDGARKARRDKVTLKFRRRYPDFSILPVQLPASDFVEEHIHRRSGRRGASPVRAEAEQAEIGA